MTRFNSQQTPLFPVRMFLPEPFAKGSIFDMLSRYGGIIMRRTDFPSAEPERGGNQGHCPILLSKLVLLQQHHGWSDRETEEHSRTDLRVKACLDVGVEFKGVSQPTLCRHRQRMQALNVDKKYASRLRDLLEAMELVGDEEPVLIDSVPIHGAGQQLDSYNLLAALTRRGIKELARVRGKTAFAVAQELGLEVYLQRSIKGRFEVDWDNEESRREFLALLVEDTLCVRRALQQEMSESHDRDIDEEPPSRTATADGLSEAIEAIDDVLEHDVERTTDGKVKGMRQRAAGDRRISATDADMRHGRKSASKLFAGFKAQIVASLMYGFIVVIRVIKGNVHDGQDLPSIVEELSDKGINPAWWGGDHAYGTLANHKYFANREEGELVARMARPANGGRFTKDEFSYDFDAHTLTCPGGHTISHSAWETDRRRKGRRFDFTTAGCPSCPNREQCVSPKAKPEKGRTVFIFDDDEELIRSHLDRREETEFLNRLANRSAVERVIAGFAQCGGKKAQRFGMKNVAFDAELSALTYNMRRLGSLLRERPELEVLLRDVWRVFARLMLAVVFCLLPRPIGRPLLATARTAVA